MGMGLPIYMMGSSLQDARRVTLMANGKQHTDAVYPTRSKGASHIRQEMVRQPRSLPNHLFRP